jgi:hypothetical protein
MVLGVFNALWWLDRGIPIHPPTGIKHGLIIVKTNKDDQLQQTYHHNKILISNKRQQVAVSFNCNYDFNSILAHN